MYNATEQFVEMNKTNMAQASKVAAITLQNAEKLFNLNLAAAKSAIEQGIENAQVVASVRDVQELFAVRTRMAESGVQSALAYSRTLYELASIAQAEFSAVSEETWSNYSKGMATWVDTAAKSAPAGSDVAVNALKSTFAATTAAIDQFQQATKQVVSLADAQVRAAAATASKAAVSTKGRKAA
ncbi:MAG TPA: phasin family protein [Casimicrobiaceae bacterium]|nr:phasin family protein [Casimicrobiaceae bacterium]